MRTLVVEDDSVAAKIIEHCVVKAPFLEHIKTCITAEEAINVIETEEIDLILLDVELPKISGIDLLKLSAGTKMPLIILCTAKKQYAVDAFDLDVVDYLVKPYSYERFLRAATRAYDIFRLRETPHLKEDEFLMLRSAGVTHKVFVNDISFVEAFGDYIKINTSNGKITTHETMKSIEEKLSNDDFMRVHKSYIVALSKIESYHNGIISIDGEEIPVSRTYKPILREYLKSKLS
jgi:DNA-binding LytR/AlgR family response regulator